ncbi:hypothetical protein QZH41_005768 [Actinostola sp. cb2023]|nr:hypothetical protein QZH41_005768 [Actinostola sp. cb2023]
MDHCMDPCMNHYMDHCMDHCKDHCMHGPLSFGVPDSHCHRDSVRKALSEDKKWTTEFTPYSKPMIVKQINEAFEGLDLHVGN